MKEELAIQFICILDVKEVDHEILALKLCFIYDVYHILKKVYMQQGKFAIDKEMRFITVRIPRDLDIEFSDWCNKQHPRKYKGPYIVKLIENCMRSTDATA